MLLTFLLVVQAIIGAALVGVILMQQSEGGGLGMGGSPTGLMSARGAADFLTRTTGILATIFVALSIVQAVLASTHSAPEKLDTTLARKPAAVEQPAATPVPGPGAVPLAADQTTPGNTAAPAPAGNTN